MSAKNIKNATFEAIYWWNRDEHYYHQYFKKIDVIYENKPLLAFFTSKVFDTFLRQYSVRRNLPPRFPTVDSFIKELIKNEFVLKVKDGDTEVIDKVSDEIKIAGISKNGTISLLSKIAFLINPNVFSLYDSVVKRSLITIINKENNDKKIKLDDYLAFLNYIKRFKDEISSQNKFEISEQILMKFQGTPAYDFFNQNPTAFKLRVVDKLLWIEGQSGNENVRPVNNKSYLDLIKLK